MTSPTPTVMQINSHRMQTGRRVVDNFYGHPRIGNWVFAQVGLPVYTRFWNLNTGIAALLRPRAHEELAR